MSQLLLEKTFLDDKSINSDDVKKVLKTIDRNITDDTIITEETFQELYERANDAKKIHLLKELIENNPEYSMQLEPAESAIMNSLISYGFDDAENKLLVFLDRSRSKHLQLEDTYVNTINNLLNNNTISVDANWLYDKQVYEGKPADIDYKIKTLAYLSNKNNLKKFGAENNPDLTVDNIKTKTVQEIKQILSDITREDNSEEEKPITETGYDIVRSKLNIQKPIKLKKENITDYIINISTPEQAKTFIEKNKNMIKQLLNSKLVVDDQLKKILEKNYKSSEDIDENIEDIFNIKLVEYVSEQLDTVK